MSFLDLVQVEPLFVLEGGLFAEREGGRLGLELGEVLVLLARVGGEVDRIEGLLVDALSDTLGVVVGLAVGAALSVVL